MSLSVYNKNNVSKSKLEKKEIDLVVEKPKIKNISESLSLDTSSNLSDSSNTHEQCDDSQYDEEDNELINTLMFQPESPVVLDYVLKELASEVTSLKRDRRNKTNTGMSTTQVSARRVDALKKIGDMWLKRQELNKKSFIDIKSDEFQLILSSLLSKVKDVMIDMTLSSETIKVFFTKLSEDLKSWEEELAKLQTLKKKENNSRTSTIGSQKEEEDDDDDFNDLDSDNIDNSDETE